LDNQAQPVAIVVAAIGPVVEMKSVASDPFSSVKNHQRFRKKLLALKKLCSLNQYLFIFYKNK